MFQPIWAWNEIPWTYLFNNEDFGFGELFLSACLSVNHFNWQNHVSVTLWGRLYNIFAFLLQRKKWKKHSAQVYFALEESLQIYLMTLFITFPNAHGKQCDFSCRILFHFLLLQDVKMFLTEKQKHYWSKKRKTEWENKIWHTIVPRGGQTLHLLSHPLIKELITV